MDEGGNIPWCEATVGAFSGGVWLCIGELKESRGMVKCPLMLSGHGMRR